MSSRTTSTRTQHTKTMCVIHHHTSAILLRQSHNLRQTANITTHREHTIRYDQFASRGRNLLQLLLQIIHIRMLVTQHLGIRQSTCIIDTRVIFTIIQNIIVLTTNGRNNRKISLKTCTTCHCSLIPCKTRQCLLQLKMQIQCTIQKTTT